MSPMAKKNVAFLILVLGFARLFGACAAKQQHSPDTAGMGNRDTLLREPLNDPPSYRLFHKSLEFYEKKLGLKFYQNSRERYQPFAASSWKSFTIADHLNECIYDVAMKGLIGYRSLDGKYEYIIEMNIEEVACGVTYPNVEVMAMDRVALMEGSVVTPEIRDQMKKGVNFCSAETFLQDVLQVPWKIRVRGEGLEQAIARNSEEIQNAMDISYGDIIFFTRYYGERNVAIYVDYGVIVYNSCFQAKATRLRPDINYRVYRLFTGFNLAQYKVNEDVFMKEIVGRPE